MHEPGFWWRKAGLASALLSPLAAVYGAVAARRMTRSGARAGLPVICIGNFTLGGAGKTPTAIAVARLLREGGEQAVFLTRGYGGNASGPKPVDAETDSAAMVGDEALLLARVAPTMLARDRVAGASAAKANGAEVIVMDDGLQNASLAKDFTLAVIDGRRGIGNGCVFPAGPLRAPLAAQLARIDALLVVGDGDAARDVADAARTRRLPVWHGRLVPDAHAVANLKTRPVLAFAGIGNPDKFFTTVAEAGLSLAVTQAFADHHRYTAEDAADLVMRAEHNGWALITTEKDHARMTGDPALAALAQRAHVLPVTMRIDEMTELKTALRKALGR